MVPLGSPPNRTSAANERERPVDRRSSQAFSFCVQKWLGEALNDKNAILLGNPDITDVGDRRSSQLVGGLVLALVSIVVLAVLGRLVLEPALAVKDLPIATLAVLSLLLVFALNRSRFHRLAAFLLCFEFVWINVLEGAARPEGPIWYALLPLSATLGGTLLRFRAAFALAGLSLLGVVLVVLGRADAIPAERGTLIAMYVALASSAAVGMAVFRQRVELERRAELEQLSAQLASSDRLESIGRLAGGIAHDFNNRPLLISDAPSAASWRGRPSSRDRRCADHRGWSP
ncbi:MAG: hypothetical protein Q8N23_12620 [Archangium sp.]|nr:hypothetical protein [Archangium sp.]MDP3574750.1 hypothetical protein [Archangium sp.]